MNASPLCGICDLGFDLKGINPRPILCDPCESWTHNQCGEWVKIQDRNLFFCKVCYDMDD